MQIGEVFAVALAVIEEQVPRHTDPWDEEIERALSGPGAGPSFCLRWWAAARRVRHRDGPYGGVRPVVPTAVDPNASNPIAAAWKRPALGSTNPLLSPAAIPASKEVGVASRLEQPAWPSCSTKPPISPPCSRCRTFSRPALSRPSVDLVIVTLR